MRPGAFAARRRGSGLDIREIRPFSDGDDFRHIDPAATARTGQVHVRAFHEERDRTVILVADFRHPMLWGTRMRLRSVAAAEALALVGWQVVENGGSVGLIALTDGEAVVERPRARSRAMARVAGALVQAHERAEALARRERPVVDLATDLDRAARGAPTGATLVLASGLDAPGAGFEAVVGGLLRRVRLSILIMRDGFERDPPRISLPFFTADGGRRTAVFSASAPMRDDRLRALREVGVAVRIVDTDAARMMEVADGPPP